MNQESPKFKKILMNDGSVKKVRNTEMGHQEAEITEGVCELGACDGSGEIGELGERTFCNCFKGQRLREQSRGGFTDKRKWAD